MATKQKTIIPGDPADLICDTCPSRFADKGNPQRTDEMARARGWHIYRGPSIVDSARNMVKVLCPECVGTPRSRIEKPLIPPGQMDLLEELHYTITPLIKDNRKRGDGS